MGDAWMEIYSGGGQVYIQEDCGAGEQKSNCIDGLGSAPLGQLTNTSITVDADTAYTVFMEATINPAGIGNTISASIDPELFLAANSPYTLEYSSGITQASSTPEPGTLPLIGAALGMLLCVRRQMRVRR